MCVFRATWTLNPLSSARNIMLAFPNWDAHFNFVDDVATCQKCIITVGRRHDDDGHCNISDLQVADAMNGHCGLNVKFRFGLI